MALFSSGIGRNSVFSLKFPFCCHVDVFSSKISPVYHRKYPYNCFSSHFCFLCTVGLFVLLLSVFLLATTVCLSLLFLMWSSGPRIDTSVQYQILESRLSPFIDINSLCYLPSVGHLSSIFLSSGSSVVHFKNGPEYYPRCFFFDKISAA